MDRFHYTIKQKLQILELVNTGQLYRLATQFPSITQKQITEWQQREHEMRMLSEKDQQTKYTLHKGPSQTRKELYQYLYQKVKELRTDRRAITVDYLIGLAKAMDPSVDELTYSGQKSLIQRFMEHFNLSIRRVTGTSGSTEDQLEEEQKVEIERFQTEYTRLIQTYQIPAANIFNMDQTGVLYENSAIRTIDFSGSQEVAIQSSNDEKKRVTVFSLMNAKGELFTQLVVYKGARDAIVKEEVEQYDDETTVHTTQQNAWCDGYVLIEWIYKLWQPMIKFLSGPKLLIIDSYPLHEDFRQKFAELDTHVLFVPKGLTWSLQPLDCGFFKVLKDHLKKEWIQNQFNRPSNEPAKREALSSALKKVFELMSDNDNTVYWRKAGLEPPYVYPTGMLIEEMSNIASQPSEVHDSSMMIEEDDNLFADK